jgi:hypothetical protein
MPPRWFDETLPYKAFLSTTEVTTPWNWVLLEKLPVVQLLKNCPKLYGTRKFIAVFTRVLHCTLHWARSIQHILPYSIHLRLTKYYSSTHVLVFLQGSAVVGLTRRQPSNPMITHGGHFYLRLSGHKSRIATESFTSNTNYNTLISNLTYDLEGRSLYLSSSTNYSISGPITTIIIQIVIYRKSKTCLELGIHSNNAIKPLLQPTHDRRLRRTWPNDLRNTEA